MVSESYQKEIISARDKYNILFAEREEIGKKKDAVDKQLVFTRENYEGYIVRSEAEINSLKNQLNSNKIYLDSVLKNNTDLVNKVNTIPNY